MRNLLNFCLLFVILALLGFFPSLVFCEISDERLSFTNFSVNKEPIQLIDGRLNIQRSNRPDFQLRYCADDVSRHMGYSLLSAEVVNIAPNFFKQRSGPSVIINITKSNSSEVRNVPFRLYQSGTGRENSCAFASMSIDILEDEPERQNHLNEIAKQFLQKIRPETQDESPLFKNREQALSATTKYMSESYINNPVGLYKITATYKPKVDGLKGEDVSTSILINVSDGSNSLQSIFDEKPHEL